MREATARLGYPFVHAQAGREGAAQLNDNELRRIRNRLADIGPGETQVTGPDIDIETIESATVDFGAIQERDTRMLSNALGLPIEMLNEGSDGLGSGKPAEARLQLFALQNEAARRRFCDQFRREFLDTILREYSPFNPEREEYGIHIKSFLDDKSDVASLIQSVGDYMSANEVREKLDMPPVEDDEIGGSYRTPAEEEAPDDAGGGGLFGSAPSDTDFRSLAEGYPISDRSECDGQVVEGPQGGLRCIPSGESGAEDDAVADGLDELAEEADSPEEFAKQTMETIEEGTGMKISGDVDTLDEEQTKALATGINSISKTDPDRLEEFSEFSQDVSRSLLDDSLRVDNNTMSSSHANYNSQHMFVNINSNGFDAKEEDAEFLVADAENMREEIAIHEFGHAFHDMALDEVGSDFSEIRDVELPEDRLEQEISPYAAETPTEAVAEMFLYQSKGNELPDDLNELYADLNGPEPLSGVDL
jgi:hypothetical protein